MKIYPKYYRKLSAFFRFFGLFSSFLFFGLNLLPITAKAQIKLKQHADIPLVKDAEILPNAWAGGLNALQFSNFDFDNDGIDDLFAFERSTNKSFVFLYKNGGWVHSVEYEYLLPQGLSSWVLWVDADCDGIKDIFTSTPLGIRVFKTSRTSNGKPQFDLLKNPILTIGASGKINLQVAPTDVPYIGDVDGDGLPDVLVYNFASGGFVEYHRNISAELGLACGALEFRRETREWGDFQECDCNTFAFAGEPCASQASRVDHAGGKTLLLIDMNSDGLPDLLTGHELCEELYFLENQGTKASAKFNAFSNQFPNKQNPANSSLFPAPYWVDVNNDGKKDLLVSRNQSFNLLNLANYQKSVSYYQNIGTNEAPVFEFRADDFLQNTMLDLGENAYPTSAILNTNGLHDVLIGYRGVLENGKFVGGLALLKNVGTSQNPSFILETDDFLGLKALEFQNIKPQFSDINGDGKVDLIFSATRAGTTQLYLIPGNETNGQISFNPEELINLNFSIGLNDNPHWIDINDDGKPDLLLGRSGGRLDYFINSGSGHQVQLNLQTQAYIGINDNTAKTNLSVITGDFNGDGKLDLISSDFSGQLAFYSDFKSGNSEAVLDLIEVNGQLVPGRVGNKSFLWAAPIKSGQALLMVGSATGGVSIFDIEPIITSIAAPKGYPTAIIYPNPGSEMVYIESPTHAKFSIIDTHGRVIKSNILLNTGRNVLQEIQFLSPGLYLFKLEFEGQNQLQFIRFIKK